MRLGNEHSGTDLWCEPKPSVTWSGRVLSSRHEGKCGWGESRPFQCFGLGSMRQDIKSEAECSEACCQDSKCGIYQYQQGRGCFFNENKDIWCSEQQGGQVDGARKCIPKFCGGQEEEESLMNKWEHMQGLTFRGKIN